MVRAEGGGFSDKSGFPFPGVARISQKRFLLALLNEEMLLILMCDAPCIFVYDCSYYTNICTIIFLLYTPRLHVST
jgi:hypothetical protein